MEEIKDMNIYQKLLSITNEIGTIAKNLEVGTGKSQYKAVGEADVLKPVKELEKKYNIYSYPKARRITDRAILTTRKEYNGLVTEGNQIFMRIETDYTFVNVDKPEETITITTYGDGVDSQDKAPGKAMTYSDKYALLKAYKIVTGEDPDQEHSPDNITIKSKKVDNTFNDVGGDELIDSVKVSALKRAIEVKGIASTQVSSVINYFGYNTIEEIKLKDYMRICEAFSKVKGEK